MGTAASLFTKSLLMGIDHATRKMEFDEIPTAEDIENLPFDEAVEYLKKRNVLSAEEYHKLSDKMKFRSFTASRIADGDILKRINARIIQNTASGGTASDFLKYTRDELLDCVGMGSGNFSYWETVYRTNVQTAYNAGRAMGFEEDKPLALEFIGIDDARTSDICRSLLSPKIVLPYDDPFWESHWPPLHFNCRSTVRGIYDESELPESYIQPEPLENPAKGFGRFPLDTDDWWRELASQTARAKEYGVQGEIERAFEKLIKESDPLFFSQDEIQKILITDGKQRNAETFIVSNKKGELLFKQKSGVQGGDISDALDKILLNAKENSVIFSHNHPQSTSFSLEDIKMAVYYKSIKKMNIFGHDGSIYTLDVRKNRRVTLTKVNEIYNSYKYISLAKYQKMIDNKSITTFQASKNAQHEIVEKVAKEFGWKYKGVLK